MLQNLISRGVKPRNVAYFTIGLLFAIFAIWNTYAPITQAWSPEVWASWVQAFGSIGAILVAVWVSQHELKNAREERQKAQRIEEVALYVRANRITQRFAMLIDSQLKQASVQINPGGKIFMKPISPAKDLWAFEPEFHRLKGAGGYFYTALDLFLRAQRVLDKHHLHEERQAKFLDRLKRAKDKCSQGRKHVATFLHREFTE